MNLKTVGYYRELPNVKRNDDSILDFIRKGDPSLIKRICSYLESGVPLIVIPEICKDVIHPEKGTSGVSSEYTDGKWLWRGDLQYYVKNYNLKLPDEFIDNMIRNEWHVSLKSDDIDLNNLKINGRSLL